MSGYAKASSKYDRTLDAHWPACIDRLTPEMFAATLFNRVHGVQTGKVPPQERVHNLRNLIKVLRDYADGPNGHWHRSIAKINRCDQSTGWQASMFPTWRFSVLSDPIPMFDQLRIALINGIPQGVKSMYIVELTRWERQGLVYTIADLHEAYLTLTFYKIENGPMPAYPANVRDKPGSV